MTIQFTVQGTPKAQPRPRAFARKFANGQVAARVYDAGTAEGWKSEIALAARKCVPSVPIEGPIELRVVFALLRPKAHFGSGKKADTLKDSAPKKHTQKPDLDNLVKAVKDCLTTIGMWRDDAQVVSETIEKHWCCSNPGAVIQIEW